MIRRAFASAFIVLAGVTLGAPASWAKVTQAEAERLKSELMPQGGVKAGNAEGSIPTWAGGLTTSPPDFKGPGSRVVDPFPQDQPLYTITRANLAQHRDKLSPAHIAMFERYAEYKMPVYQTRRTAASPQFVYDATYRNALSAELKGDGEALVQAATGIPFPIPQTAKEAVWNHKVRYRGLGGNRYNVQIPVQTNGVFTPSVLTEEARFHYSYPNVKPEDLGNVIVYFFQIQLAPARTAGTMFLVHETMDQVKEHRRAWLYNPGQRRLRRAPNAAYDAPGNASDGMRTADNFDMFNGAMDRYDWKLIGKREMIVPYNAYKLHSDKYTYADICKQRHLNQDLARYELHRVWVVEANIREGTSHLYTKRVNYIDEDSWTILVTNLYDRRDQLWRFQEGHVLEVYHHPYMTLGMEVVYDLQSDRYITIGMNNEHPEMLEKEYPIEYFDPSTAVKRAAK